MITFKSKHVAGESVRFEGKKRYKVHPVTGHEGTEVE
jgi:hypothetical protein